MADMHTPLLIAINEEGDERATMRLDDLPGIRSVIDTLIDWQETDPTRRLTIRAPSQDAETIKALREQIAMKDTALKVALTWSDADWVGHEVVTAALAGSAS